MIKATINPTGLLTDGFVGYLGAYSISGLGLNTFGFIWGVNDIWTPFCECVEAVWVECACNSACD